MKTINLSDINDDFYYLPVQEFEPEPGCVDCGSELDDPADDYCYDCGHDPYDDLD